MKNNPDKLIQNNDDRCVPNENTLLQKTLLQKNLLFYYRKLYDIKSVFFSTKLEPIKILFDIRKLTIFFLFWY